MVNHFFNGIATSLNILTLSFFITILFLYRRNTSLDKNKIVLFIIPTVIVVSTILIKSYLENLNSVFYKHFLFFLPIFSSLLIVFSALWLFIKMKQIEKYYKTSVFVLISISIGLLNAMLENYNCDSINFGVAFESSQVNIINILFYSIGYITPLIILLVSSKKILLWTDKKKMTEICFKIILILLLYNALIKLLYFLMISLTNSNHYE